MSAVGIGQLSVCLQVQRPWVEAVKPIFLCTEAQPWSVFACNIIVVSRRRLAYIHPIFNFFFFFSDVSLMVSGECVSVLQF